MKSLSKTTNSILRKLLTRSVAMQFTAVKLSEKTGKMVFKQKAPTIFECIIRK